MHLTNEVQMKISRMLATILGCLMMLLGLAAVLVPDRVLPFARFTTTANGVYVAAAIRLAIGLILLMAAAGSRFPIVLRVLGGFAIVAVLLASAGLFGIVVANAVNFIASAQAYSDPVLTLSSAFFLGCIFATATLDERLATAKAPTPAATAPATA